jgi:hypothetical protein
MYSVFMNNAFIDAICGPGEAALADMRTARGEQVCGDVYFGKALLFPYRCENISIVESEKWGFQELHLHGLKPIKPLDEVVETYYREGLEQGFDPVERPDLYANKEKINITVSNMRRFLSGSNGDYSWTPFVRDLKFLGYGVRGVKDHCVFKPVQAADLMSDYIKQRMTEQSLLRKILPPNPIP